MARRNDGGYVEGRDAGEGRKVKVKEEGEAMKRYMMVNVKDGRRGEESGRGDKRGEEGTEKRDGGRREEMR